jgi:hypothetical protein
MHARWVVVVMVVAAFGVLAAAVASAPAATPCGTHGALSNAGGHSSCSYTTVGEDTFSVPAGVTSVSVVAVGAPGGNGGLYSSASANGAPGGVGAAVTAPSVAVAALSTVYVEIGGPGGHGIGTYPGAGFCPGGAAGADGGGAGGNARCFGGSGGGGGGESDVRAAPASSGGLTGGAGDPRLVVAGGGGGGGGEYYTAGGTGGASGGSASGGAGAGGSVDCTAPQSGVPGGTGETGAGGGAAGVTDHSMFCIRPFSNGQPGAAASGGAGGDGNQANSTGPGGGGGGYFGGGGGDAIGGVDAPGGGGGSSFAPAGATFAPASSTATPASVTISWVVPSTAKPTSEVAPAISGTPAAGRVLSCSPGSWANQPIAFAYQWSRNGTPLAGATSSTYTVASLDEGSMLTCTVTASNASGSASMTSAGVRVPVPFVPRCPAASGSLSGGRLGLVRLGMTRAQAHRAYRHSSDRGLRYEDFFCLTPIGVRVGYASPKLVSAAPASAQVRGRVVWASTSNPRYAIHGVRGGALLKFASRHLHVGKVLPVGRNDWYLAPAGSVTAVLKVRRGVVEEIGIAERALTRTRKQQSRFMRSFD